MQIRILYILTKVCSLNAFASSMSDPAYQGVHLNFRNYIQLNVREKHLSMLKLPPAKRISLLVTCILYTYIDTLCSVIMLIS